MKHLKKDLRTLSGKLDVLVRKMDSIAKEVDKLKSGIGSGKTKASRTRGAAEAGRKKKKAAKTRGMTATGRVLRMIKRSKKGMDVATLIKQSGFEDRKVRNILARAVRQGKITRAGKGFYVAQEERRRHPRINSLNLVSYTCLDRDNRAVKQAMGRTLDVTEGGILLETHVPLEMRCVVSLTIGVEDDMVDVQGRVVHCRRNEGGRFKSGIQFTGMDKSSLRILKKFIAAFKKEQSGQREATD
jgi:hypothetical protein